MLVNDLKMYDFAHVKANMLLHSVKKKKRQYACIILCQPHNSVNNLKCKRAFHAICIQLCYY